jgi:hypothetical protein
MGNDPSAESVKEFNAISNSNSTKAGVTAAKATVTTSSVPLTRDNAGDQSAVTANVNDSAPSSDEDAVNWENGESLGAGEAKVADDVDLEDGEG